ncbi:MAG: endolytic transglycosylase MltG, partial [Patescibacteria group bacterium]
MDPQKHLKRAAVLLVIILVLYILVSLASYLLSPPKSFPSPYSVTIDNGQSLFSISKELEDDGVIKSRRVFEMLMLTFGNDKTISRGEYYFDKPTGVVSIALRISGRDFGIDRTKVTFPEGFTNRQMSERLGVELHNFDTKLFLDLSKGSEGYLFPDTYHFMPWATPDAVVNTLKKTFDQKTKIFSKDIEDSEHSLKDIIVMASIIEKEANGENDRAVISGILWKRIDKGIPLQVDAPFLYILGKESSELTRNDLAIDSPFNTYKY